MKDCIALRKKGEDLEINERKTKVKVSPKVSHCDEEYSLEKCESM
jgi:hypothetical protein